MRILTSLLLVGFLGFGSVLNADDDFREKLDAFKEAHPWFHPEDVDAVGDLLEEGESLNAVVLFGLGDLPGRLAVSLVGTIYRDSVGFYTPEQVLSLGAARVESNPILSGQNAALILSNIESVPTNEVRIQEVRNADGTFDYRPTPIKHSRPMLDPVWRALAQPNGDSPRKDVFLTMSPRLLHTHVNPQGISALELRTALSSSQLHRDLIAVSSDSIPALSGVFKNRSFVVRPPDKTGWEAYIKAVFDRDAAAIFSSKLGVKLVAGQGLYEYAYTHGVQAHIGLASVDAFWVNVFQNVAAGLQKVAAQSGGVPPNLEIDLSVTDGQLQMAFKQGETSKTEEVETPETLGELKMPEGERAKALALRMAARVIVLAQTRGIFPESASIKVRDKNGRGAMKRGSIGQSSIEGVALFDENLVPDPFYVLEAIQYYVASRAAYELAMGVVGGNPHPAYEADLERAREMAIRAVADKGIFSPYVSTDTLAIDPHHVSRADHVVEIALKEARETLRKYWRQLGRIYEELLDKGQLTRADFDGLGLAEIKNESYRERCAISLDGGPKEELEDPIRGSSDNALDRGSTS